MLRLFSRFVLSCYLPEAQSDNEITVLIFVDTNVTDIAFHEDIGWTELKHLGVSPMTIRTWSFHLTLIISSVCIWQLAKLCKPSKKINWIKFLFRRMFHCKLEYGLLAICSSCFYSIEYSNKNMDNLRLPLVFGSLLVSIIYLLMYILYLAFDTYKIASLNPLD
jgi:hypothetical protein